MAFTLPALTWLGGTRYSMVSRLKPSNHEHKSKPDSQRHNRGTLNDERLKGGELQGVGLTALRFPVPPAYRLP